MEIITAANMPRAMMMFKDLLKRGEGEGCVSGGVMERVSRKQVR